VLPVLLYAFSDQYLEPAAAFAPQGFRVRGHDSGFRRQFIFGVFCLLVWAWNSGFANKIKRIKMTF